MCLGVPGRVLEVVPTAIGIPTGRVDFGGVVKEVCLAYTPEVEVGEYVIVHVGFAISRVDEVEARRMLEYLAGTGELEGELAPGAGSGAPRSEGA